MPHGAKNEGDRLWLETPCRFAWKGVLFEKEANPKVTGLKRVFVNWSRGYTVLKPIWLRTVWQARSLHHMST